MTIDTYNLEARYTADHGTVFVTGLQALARLPLEQLRYDRIRGLDTAAFVSGYQGSPLGGFGDAVARAAATSPDLPVVLVPGFNEEYAATAVMGSQLAAARPDAKYDGVVGIWYGKAPGVDRAADALRHAVFAGASHRGGAVAIVGDDPNAKSSTVPSSSAGLISDMHMPLLYPGDPVEALDLGRHAIAMSRATGLWAALKVVADVADATANIELNPERVTPVVPLLNGESYVPSPDGRLLTPHTVELEREILEIRYELAKAYAAENHLNRVTVDPPHGWIGLVASGITYREVREALARLGLADDEAVRDAGIRLLKMGMPLPFNPETVRSFARGLDEIFVLEEKQPNIESLIKDALYPLSVRPIVVGKHDENGKQLLPGWGGLDSDLLVPLLRGRLSRRLGDRLAPLPVTQSRALIPVAVERSPYFCSGCPHNRSTEVPNGALVGAGIGCHTMTLLMDEARVGEIVGITCMGNEGTQWIGMAPFVEHAHLIQNLGDGTFFHSGQLAIQAAVAADVNITYKLLYNGTVAMTGGQDPQGQLGVPDIAAILLRQGVEEVLVTTEDVGRYRRAGLPSEVRVWDRTRLIEAQEHLASVGGVTVLIHDQECAAEVRRARKRGLVETPPQRIVINDRICEGCGDCGQVSNCLSVTPIDTRFGTKRAIDQTTCNLDYSCLEGDCPSFMTVTQKSPGRIRRSLGRMSTRSRNQRATRLPEAPNAETPTLVVPADDFAMRITGIGGTGVVTIAQVLGTAAMFAGYEVRGLDQIGLSQKAGPVVSDIRLSKASASYTNRLGSEQADLLLALDQLVAGSERGLSAARPDKTLVVGSTSATPTGAMILDPDVALPSATELADRIGAVSRSDQYWADVQNVTTDLFGSATAANMFVVGMAVQAGALPIEASYIEEAISLNGVAVDENTQAFRWGRTQVADADHVAITRQRINTTPAAELETHIAELDVLGVTGAVRSKLQLYARELEAWGAASTVAAWFESVGRVARAERSIRSDSTELLEAFASGLFKLTAYKDEYEVARLMSDHPTLETTSQLAGDHSSVAWKLHPPVLRAMGMSTKISIGTWAAPGVRWLARGKRVRGSWVDPFRHGEVRRVERTLAGHYREAVFTALDVLDEDVFGDVVELAELAEKVRGYEQIKLGNVAVYKSDVAAALSALGIEPVR